MEDRNEANYRVMNLPIIIIFDELFKSGVELFTLTFEDTAQSRIFYPMLEITAGRRKTLQWCLIDTISNFILIRLVNYWVPHLAFTHFMFLEFHVSPYQILQIPYLVGVCNYSARDNRCARFTNCS